MSCQAIHAERGIAVKDITIVIPVFNEEESLAETIHQVEQIIVHPRIHFDAIFIDDASTDNTSVILSQIDNADISVLRHTQNRGYGAAIKSGLRHTKSPYICIADSDGTYPLKEIPRMAELVGQDYSMVVGSRTGKHVKIPLLRKFPKWVINKLANYLSGINIPDINSGLRIMKKEDTERFLNILPDGFSFTTTITLAMLTNGLDVHYIPIDYYARSGKSKIRPFYDTLNFLQLIIRTCLYFNPLKVFIPLSLILLLLAFSSLLVSWLLTGKVMDVTFGVITMTSVFVLAIGMLADLIDKRLP